MPSALLGGLFYTDIGNHANRFFVVLMIRLFNAHSAASITRLTMLPSNLYSTSNLQSTIKPKKL